MPGTIKLILKFGKETGPVRSAYYFNFDDMMITINIWRSIYKQRFEKYHVHAMPKLKDERHFTKPKK